MSNPTLPQPPPGYHSPEPFAYPKMKLQVAALLILLPTAGGLLYLIWLLQGDQINLIFRIEPADLLLVILTLIITITVHEWLHGVAYQLLGYRVTYGVSWHLLAAYAGAFGQWQQRNHNLITALTPLVSLTVLLTPLLAIPVPRLTLLIFVALLFNTSGAVGDLYLAGRLWRLPRRALLYDVDIRTMLIYRPVDEGK